MYVSVFIYVCVSVDGVLDYLSFNQTVWCDCWGICVPTYGALGRLIKLHETVPAYVCENFIRACGCAFMYVCIRKLDSDTVLE
jgi:hypothetical protein